MARKIQIKRGLEESLPSLDIGELGFTTDTKKLFVGGTEGNVNLTESYTSKVAAELAEANAKLSETNAKASETASKTSETNAKTSETNASDTLDTFRDEIVEYVRLSPDTLLIDDGFTPTFGSAAQTGIDDVANHYNSSNVEGALQEVGTKFTTVSGQLAEKAKITLVADKRWDTNHSKKSFMRKYVFPDSDFNVFPISLLTDGHIYVTNFDVSAFKNTGGTTYYISPTGSAGNNGTSVSTPYESLTHAYANAVDGDTIIAMDGTYTRNMWLGAAYIEKSINIIAQNSGKVIVKNGDNHTYTVNGTYPTVYQTARSNVSKAIQTFAGETVELTNVASIALVSTTEGSWFNDGTNTYVHLFGEVIPTDSNCILTLRTGSALIYTACSLKNVNLYVEGITFIGGNKGTVNFANSPTYTSPKLYAKNCAFKHAHDESIYYDAVSVRGATAYFQNCEASFSNKDGFNYHWNNNVPSKAIEINCVGRCNGAGTANPYQNGSTIHDGGKIIRVNGLYHSNYGGNVADTHVGTKSLNLGCTAFNSTAESNDLYDADFVAQQAGTEMWIENCKGFGSAYTMYAITGATIHISNCDYESISGNGTISIA